MADLQIFAAESLQAIRAKADTLLAKVDALAVTAPTLPEAQELLKNAQMLASYIEQQRAAAKAPYLEKGREIDELAKQLVAPVETAKEKVKGKIMDYNAELERKRKARELAVANAQRAISAAQDEAAVDAVVAGLDFDDLGVLAAAEARKTAIAQAREQAAEAKRLDAERKELAKIAKKQGEEAAAIAQEKARQEAEARKLEQDKQDAARKAQQEQLAKEAERAASEAAARAKVQAPKGVRKVAKFEVTDAAKLPREYLCADEKAIRAAVNAGAREISGVRIWEDMDVR
jgi:colicin import membrane protein